MRELSKSWPILGMAIVVFLSVVIFRTPELGFNAQRVGSILLSAISLITVGVYIERIRCAREIERREKEDSKP